MISYLRNGMMDSIGLINKILPYSFVDGPGNRAVVFLQGCNLHCKYCHNPYTINVCNNCGICVPNCPQGALYINNDRVLWSKERCIECDTCIQCCPKNSSPKVTGMTAIELWQFLREKSSFISGITISGGEPTLQVPFLVDFFKIVKANSSLNTLIETNGFIGPEVYAPLLPVLDMAIVDLKSSNSKTHESLTSRLLQPVLRTIEFLYKYDKLYSIQQVIIPGYTDSEDDMAGTVSTLIAIGNDIQLKLLKFRPHGTSGEAQFWDSPSEEQMDKLVELAKSLGLKNVTRSL